MYFNGGRSHTYEYGLPVNFTRTSSFCASRVFILLVESKLLVNSINVIYKKLWRIFDVTTDIILKLFIIRDVQFCKNSNFVVEYCCLFAKHFLVSI